MHRSTTPDVCNSSVVHEPGNIASIYLHSRVRQASVPLEVVVLSHAAHFHTLILYNLLIILKVYYVMLYYRAKVGLGLWPTTLYI